MLKEINHRYGYYLTAVIVVILLLLIYVEVKTLRQDVSTITVSEQVSQSNRYLSENYEVSSNELVDFDTISF